MKLPCKVRVPVREPRAVGVNVTFTVQLAPTANEVPQLLVWAKSPLIKTPVIVAGRSPEMVNVTGTAVLVVFTGSTKKSDGSEAVATIAWPVPETSTPGAAFSELVTIESVAVHVPRFKGAKVTLMVQLEPAANDEPQLFVWLN